MIVRRTNDINPDAKEVLITVSYTESDCKIWIDKYCLCLCAYGMPDILDGNYKESEIRHFLEHEPTAFGFYAPKYAAKLSRWAFKQILRIGLLIPSANTKNMFIFSDDVKSIALKKAKKKLLIDGNARA